VAIDKPVDIEIWNLTHVPPVMLQ